MTKAIARRLPGDEAADLLESGNVAEVWLELPSVFRYVRRLGYDPAVLLHAVLSGDFEVLVIRDRPIISAEALLEWLANTRQPEEPLN